MRRMIYTSNHGAIDLGEIVLAYKVSDKATNVFLQSDLKEAILILIPFEVLMHAMEYWKVAIIVDPRAGYKDFHL